MKKAILIALMALSVIPISEAAPRESRSIVSGGQSGYCAVLSNSTIFASGSVIFSGETGFTQCASTAAGICGLKSDGSAKCTNGNTYDGPYVKIFSSSISLSPGGQYGYGYLVFLKTDGTYENFEIGGNWVNLPSQTTVSYGSSQGGSSTTGNYQMVKTDGSCFNANFGTSTDSVSLPAGQCVSVGTHYLVGTTKNNAFLKTDGTIQRTNRFADSVGVSFSGTYRELFSIDMQSATIGTCAIRESDGFPICAGNAGAWITNNAPNYEVRDIAVFTGPTQGVVAVRVSDNSLVMWSSTGSAIIVGFVDGEPETTTSEFSDGLVCSTIQYPNVSDVSWMTPGFFSLTGSYTRTDYPGESQYACNNHISYTTCGDKINIYNKSPDELSLDRFNAYNYSAPETLIFSGSWQYPASGSRSVMVRDPEFSRYMIALGSIRNSAAVQSNVFQFYSVANPSPSIPWAGVWSPKTKEWVSVWSSTGGVATIAWDFGISDIILQLRDMSVPPLGFRRGIANSFLSKTDCSKGSNACESYLRGTELVCSGKFENGYFGNCEFDSYGRCAPIARDDGSYTAGVPAEGSKVVYDSQGNVVVVIPESSAVNPNSGRVDGNSIFSCEDGEGYLSCVLTVLRNGWQAINDTFSSADSVGNSVENVTSRIGSGSSGSLYTGTFGTGSSEPIGERVLSGGWNMISGNAGQDPFRLLIKRIWTSAIFLLFFFSIVVLYAVIRRRKENSNPEA